MEAILILVATISAILAIASVIPLYPFRIGDRTEDFYKYPTTRRELYKALRKEVD